VNPSKESVSGSVELEASSTGSSSEVPSPSVVSSDVSVPSSTVSSVVSSTVSSVVSSSVGIGSASSSVGIGAAVV